MKEVIQKFVLKTIECDFDAHFVYVDVDIDDPERNEKFSLRGELELDLVENYIYPIWGKIEMNIWNTADNTFINILSADTDIYETIEYNEEGEKTSSSILKGEEAKEAIFSEVNERLRFLFNMYFPYGSTCHC